MKTNFTLYRLARRTLTVSVLVLTLLALPMHVDAAATNNVSLRLRPHCESQNQQECASYAVKDPLTLITPDLVPGSILDMDLVIDNPTSQPITRLRGWLSYDPVIFEGKKIEPTQKFPVITPGEADFAPLQGFIQIGMTAANDGTVSDPVIPVARIQLLIKQIPGGSKTVIAFYDVQSGTEGHTNVITKDNGTDKNILTDLLGSLLVSFKQDAGAASSVTAAPSSAASVEASSIPSSLSSVSSDSSVSSVSSASSESSVAGPDLTANVTGTGATAERTSFVLLQIQNVRITTEGSTVYTAWDPLPSAELKGYNVYYGADTGRYLQRRTLPAESTTLALRALPLDTTYFVAVRAINKNDEESAFSQEVAVKVGDPATSTAPLRGITDTGPQGKNPLEQKKTPTHTVPGETGMESTMVLFLVISAVIGTFFALRRQFIAATVRL